MKFLTSARSKITAALIGLAVCAVAMAATGYVGWDPSTGLNGVLGAQVSVGTLPVVSGTCGTRGAIAGGPAAGTIVSGAVTTCTTTLTFPAASPTGWNCTFQDITTPADLITQASSTTTSCTSSAATIVSGDIVKFLAIGY